MATPKDVLEFVLFIPTVYKDIGKLVDQLKFTFGDNYMKFIADSGAAVKMLTPDSTREERIEAARKIADLAERATRPK